MNANLTNFIFQNSDRFVRVLLAFAEKKRMKSEHCVVGESKRRATSGWLLSSWWYANAFIVSHVRI